MYSCVQVPPVLARTSVAPRGLGQLRCFSNLFDSSFVLVTGPGASR